MDISINQSRYVLFGDFTVSGSVIVAWIVSGILIMLALIIRFVLLRKFKTVPHGTQNVIELCVESVRNYCISKLGFEISMSLNAYMFTLVVFILGCGLIELIGFRPPTSDLSLTASLALMTFFLINYYGLKYKGLLGRIKSFGQPKAFIAPIKVVTDLAVPISLSCRLFGNMLGGVIIMELIYNLCALVIPAFISIYFNLFHAGMQTFIFVTLTLTYIAEAIE